MKPTKKKTNKKELEKMEKETARAVAHVNLLNKLYEDSIRKSRVKK